MGESGGRTPVEKIPVQNILRKNKKSWKVRQKSKNVDICFFCIYLEHWCQKSNPTGQTGHKVLSPCSFGIFLIFPNVLSPSSFGNLWGYIKFVIIDIKLHFTCDEWKLYWYFVNFPNIMTRIVINTCSMSVSWKILHCRLETLPAEINVGYKQCRYFPMLFNKWNTY